LTLYSALSKVALEKEEPSLGLIDPVVAIIVSLSILVLLLYKRVNLGIVLNATALLLALLTLEWTRIPTLIWETSANLLTISVVSATFVIMLLSQLYKETGLINSLSESMGKLVKNPKIVMCVLPAIIGFLPVAGGALMSAPLVDSEAEKLKLKPEKKAYVNLWFRHTIFPVYPLSQVLIVAAALGGTTTAFMILRQIPVVAVMVIVGYVIGFWKFSYSRKERISQEKSNANSNFGSFFVSFSPILASIIVAISLSSVFVDLSKLGFDVLIASLAGLAVLIIISKPRFQIFTKPFKSWGIYGITFAAYGAFLLGAVMRATGISELLKTFAMNGNVDSTALLVIIPAVLGVLTASALGGVTIGFPILSSMFTLSPKMASLIYMSAYLGYVISPTHLCFTFTADYFKCHHGKLYKYVIPSFLITFPMVLIVYFLF